MSFCRSLLHHLQLLLDAVGRTLGRLLRPVRRLDRLLVDPVAGLLRLVSRFLATARRADLQLLQHPLRAVLQLGEDRSAGRRGAVTEVRRLPTGQRLELFELGALGDRDAVAVEVRLELRLRPGVKGRLPRVVRGRGERRGRRGVGRAAGLGGTRIRDLGLLDQLLTGRILLLGGGLGGLVGLLSEPFPGVSRVSRWLRSIRRVGRAATHWRFALVQVSNVQAE